MSAWAPPQLRRSMLLGSARLLRTQPRVVFRANGAARCVFGSTAAPFPSARPAFAASAAEALSRGVFKRAKDTRIRQFAAFSPALSSDEPFNPERCVGKS